MLGLKRLERAVLRVQCATGFTSMRRRTISTFYEHTCGRWLYNDAEQHLARYSPFNVQELYKTACESLDARECTSMVKLPEDSESRNRIFRMTFDNGRTAIARIPLPRPLGHVSSVVASEVATTEFCRGLGLFGVPQIYTWCKEPSNPVGSAYIITEDVVGTTLSANQWAALRDEPLENAVSQIAIDLIRLQTIARFSQLGSIYFKDDLPSELQSRPLLRNSFVSENLHLFPDAVSQKLLESVEKYRIGPMASWPWWCNHHDDPEADRGPWRNFGEFIEAAARLELRTLQKYRADPKSLRFSSSTTEDLDEIQGLLGKVLVLAPHLSATLIYPQPQIADMLTDVVLGHPNLLASNVIVPHLTPDNAAERMATLTYTHWQCAAVLPFPMHVGVPPIIQYDGELFELPSDPREDIELPSNMAKLSQEQQQVIRTQHHLAMRQMLWPRTMLKLAYPPFLITDVHDLYPAISHLPIMILRACSAGPWLLRETLIQICRDWNTEQWGSCPITFSEEEMAAHKVGFAEYAGYHALIIAAKQRLGCDMDGWVPNDKYDEASRLLAAMHTEWLASHSTPFPLTDGAWSSYLS